MPADPLSGRAEVGVHVFPVRVYYEDTDAGGLVYHSNYLRFAERARTELLRSFGLQQSRLRAEDGILFVMRRCVADFLAPARLDDLLLVASRLIKLHRVSLEFEQNVTRDGLELVRLYVTLACLNINGRPARLPPTVRDALAKPWNNVGSDHGKRCG